MQSWSPSSRFGKGIIRDLNPLPPSPKNLRVWWYEWKRVERGNRFLPSKSSSSWHVWKLPTQRREQLWSTSLATLCVEHSTLNGPISSSEVRANSEITSLISPLEYFDSLTNDMTWIYTLTFICISFVCTSLLINKLIENKQLVHGDGPIQACEEDLL